MAEGVAAAIEVKSDVRSQWKQVVEKAEAIRKLKVLEKKYTDEEETKLIQELHPDQVVTPVESAMDPVRIKKGGIPFFCVGFEGWSDISTVREKDREVGSILVLRHAIYAGGLGSAQGPIALLMFLEYIASLLRASSVAVYPGIHYGLMSQMFAEHPERMID